MIRNRCERGSKRTPWCAWLCAAGFACSALLAGCRSATDPPSLLSPPSSPLGPIVLRDATTNSEIAFRHSDGSSGERFIVESVSAGLALFDYDNDGLIDIYFPCGAPLRGAVTESLPRDALYRNLGDWRFRDVTQQAGLSGLGYGLGIVVADYDNDGFADIYLNQSGPNVLYRNNGDGTFTDATARATVANGDKVGAGAAFLDSDRDGDLDLYVANYVDFTYDNHVPSSIGGVPVYAGPRSYSPVPDVLYRNNGDGTFTDISDESGIAAHASTGMGMVCADFDNDRHTDIFVCNDSRGNFLFHNDGTGRFQEIALAAGFSCNYFGDDNASMGVDCGDYNNDGWLDFYVTDYSGEWPVLYENTGHGFLNDVSRRTGAALGAYPYVTWGAGLVDFDNDGHRDLYIACGHIDDNVERYNDTTSYRARNILLRNQGDGTFRNVSDQAGDGLLPNYSSRGACFDDLDGDGCIDVVVLNSANSPPFCKTAPSTATTGWGSNCTA